MWFRERSLIQLMVVTEILRTLFNFVGKASDAKAWRWRKLWETLSVECPVSSFAENPDLFPSIAGVPSLHTESILQTSNSCFVKMSFTNWNISFTLVVFSSSLKKKFSFMVQSWTYRTNAISWLKFETSVVSFNWREIFKGLAFIYEITCSKISDLKYVIHLWMTLFENGSNSSSFLASFPIIVVAISDTHDLTSFSATVWDFNLPVPSMPWRPCTDLCFFLAEY